MAGQNLAAAVAKVIGGTMSWLSLDSVGNLLTSNGGASRTPAPLSAAAVISASARRVAKVIIIDPGTTGGAFTLNDTTTTGGAAAGNVVWSLPYNGTNAVAGAVFTLDVPLTTGLVLSAVPTGGTPKIIVSYS